ncbi:MAG: sodium:solute symporter family protein [Deltaproteobacteria bacterium]|jgi:SSS family solute:Na+ symporter|nr:sodium:solute symporter family protein [Deltaproteobacteria bacterium]
MALTVFSLVLLSSILISVLSMRGVIKGKLTDVLVASGSFGPALLFFIMVGENYTTGTLLGAPGSIYSNGASYGFWFIPYILLAYPVAYFLSPAIWRMGRLSQGATVGDILGWRYDSRLVEVLAAVCAIVFLTPIIQIQLTALSLVFRYLNINIGFEHGVLLAVILAYLMILLSGIRAPAYVSILKDALLILAILVVGVVCLKETEGGAAGVFARVLATAPETLTVPRGGGSGLPDTMSTVFFMMLTLNIYPILVAGTLTSSSERNVRKSVVIMPVYMLMFPFLVLAAYFALVNLPGLEKDTAVLAVAALYLPEWLLGLIAGGVALTAVLVVSVNALSIAGLFSRNVYRVLKPRADERELIVCVKAATFLALAAGALAAVKFPNLLANILKMSYSGMAQLLSAFVFAFFWKRATPLGVVAGICLGFVCLALFWNQPSFYGVNKGCAALAVNFAAGALVSLTGIRQTRAPERYLEYARSTPWTFSGKEKGGEG